MGPAGLADVVRRPRERVARTTETVEFDGLCHERVSRRRACGRHPGWCGRSRLADGTGVRMWGLPFGFTDFARGLTVLTFRTVSMVVGDQAAAMSVSEHLLDGSLSPAAFARPEDSRPAQANSIWVGSKKALGQLGLDEGDHGNPAQLAMALLGRHSVTGMQVCKPNFAAVPDAVRPVPPDTQGGTRRKMVVDSLELTFWVPGSVSWLWARARAELRGTLENILLQSAHCAVGNVVGSESMLPGHAPAEDFAALLTLHVINREGLQRSDPPPLLHVHGHLIGVVDDNGKLRTPKWISRDPDIAMRYGGAIGRSLLLQTLRKEGFVIKVRTGPEGGYFEVAGVPAELSARASVWGSVRAECGGPYAPYSVGLMDR